EPGAGQPDAAGVRAGLEGVPPDPERPVAAVRRTVPRRSSTSGGGLVEEALALRDALRALLGRVRALVEEARRQRQEHRLVRATLASLRQLQTVG
ncbi:MAG TPA: hypothetical protein VKE74_20570, partial [Gemmataceae bacterium]|nr:hypothetical protein [Gemmataceae bacterium]